MRLGDLVRTPSWLTFFFAILQAGKVVSIRRDGRAVAQHPVQSTNAEAEKDALNKAFAKKGIALADVPLAGVSLPRARLRVCTQVCNGHPPSHSVTRPTPVSQALLCMREERLRGATSGARGSVTICRTFVANRWRAMCSIPTTSTP